MKISHVVYKVSDLDAALERYRDDGFDIEYGRAKDPLNAIAYFADGSYLELTASTGVSDWSVRLLRIIGKRAFAGRIGSWDAAEEGLIGLALGGGSEEVDDAMRSLKAAGEKYFRFNAQRTEPTGRTLRFAGAMPDEMRIPFLSSCDIDLRREGFVHPNGVVGFKSVSFGTTAELMPLVDELCTDDRVQLFIGDGVRDLEFAYGSD